MATPPKKPQPPAVRAAAAGRVLQEMYTEPLTYGFEQYGQENPETLVYGEVMAEPQKPQPKGAPAPPLGPPPGPIQPAVQGDKQTRYDPNSGQWITNKRHHIRKAPTV